MINLKLYILARKDAPIGKIMAHVGHVCCLVMKHYMDICIDIVIESIFLDDFDVEYKKLIDEWIKQQTKIVLGIKDQEELYKFETELQCKTHTYSLPDIHTKERYCLAIGPISDERAKELGLKKLGLFK